MKINITAGDCLNKILIAKYPNETFIPFKEAMIEGKYTSEAFSEDFFVERAIFHNTTVKEYKKHMGTFLELLAHLNDYNEIILWFGNEPFCLANIKVIIETLKNRKYTKKIVINFVIEETGEIINSQTIQ